MSEVVKVAVNVFKAIDSVSYINLVRQGLI